MGQVVWSEVRLCDRGIEFTPVRHNPLNFKNNIIRSKNTPGSFRDHSLLMEYSLQIIPVSVDSSDRESTIIYWYWESMCNYSGSPKNGNRDDAIYLSHTMIVTVTKWHCESPANKEEGGRWR